MESRFESYQPTMGTGFNINAIPAALFAIVAFAFNEAAYKWKRFVQPSFLLIQVKLRRHVVGYGLVQVYRRVIIPNGGGSDADFD